MLGMAYTWIEAKLEQCASLGVPLLIVLLYCLAIGMGMGLTFQRMGSGDKSIGSLITAFGWGMSGLAIAGQITMWVIQVWLIHTTALVLGGDVRGEAKRLMVFSGYCYLPLTLFTLVHVISTIVNLPTYISQNPQELATLLQSIQGTLWFAVTKSLSQAAWVVVLAGQSFAVSRIYRLSWMRSVASVVIPIALGWGVSTWLGQMLHG